MAEQRAFALRRMCKRGETPGGGRVRVGAEAGMNLMLDMVVMKCSICGWSRSVYVVEVVLTRTAY